MLLTGACHDGQNETYGNLTKDKVREILDDIRGNAEVTA